MVVDWVTASSEEFGSSMERPRSTELPGPPLPPWSVGRLGTARVGGRPRRLLVVLLGFLTTVWTYLLGARFWRVVVRRLFDERPDTSCAVVPPWLSPVRGAVSVSRCGSSSSSSSSNKR